MSKVIDLNKFKHKKEQEENDARARRPLYASHLDKKDDMGDRMQRIKASLDRINNIMKELKLREREEE